MKGETPTLAEVKKLSPRKILFRWSDGTEKIISSAEIRRNCRCALCVDELSGVRTLDSSGVPEDLTIEKIGLVGRYALSFEFSDFHATGIYPFAVLREMKS